jgi:membrane associated rhomboid family serine protease
MFLHGGIFHIFFNMWCLWDLGALCESLYGRWTYAAIYLITGVALARPTAFGVKATRLPAMAVATAVIPTLTLPSGCSWNQM